MESNAFFFIILSNVRHIMSSIHPTQHRRVVVDDGFWFDRNMKRRARKYINLLLIDLISFLRPPMTKNILPAAHSSDPHLIDQGREKLIGMGTYEQRVESCWLLE